MLLITGTVRLPPDQLAVARPIMRRMIEASRAEPECVAYSYAEDVLDAGLIRVTEIWRDRVRTRRAFRFGAYRCLARGVAGAGHYRPESRLLRDRRRDGDLNSRRRSAVLTAGVRVGGAHAGAARAGAALMESNCFCCSGVSRRAGTGMAE